MRAQHIVFVGFLFFCRTVKMWTKITRGTPKGRLSRQEIFSIFPLKPLSYETEVSMASVSGQKGEI